MKRSNLSKNTSETLSSNNSSKILKGFTIYYAIIVIIFSFNSTAIGQIQINTGGAISTFALNKSELEITGESKRIYIGSRYLSLGVGYTTEHNFYFGLESSIYKSNINGSSYNAFGSAPGEWQRTSYEAYSYNYKLGLRIAYIFRNGEMIRPFISAGLNYTITTSWVVDNVKTYNDDTGNGSVTETTTDKFDSNTGPNSMDLRFGVSVYYNEHFIISGAIEIASNTCYLDPYNDISNGFIMSKTEIAIPIIFCYQF